MIPFTKRHLLRTLALATLVAAAPWSIAQDNFATKPVRIVVPYPAGGSADAVARVYATKLAELLGSGAVVVVDNKPGASGTIGADSVVRAEPDGHTLLLTVTSQLSNAVFNTKPNYDALKDFAPVIGVTLAPMALAVRADMPVASLKEFEQRAKTTPMAYGSYGVGTSAHVMVASFGRDLGVKFVHAPYRGEAAMVTDLLGGQIQFGLLTVGAARELQNAGKVKLLATVGPVRSEFLPKLPTFGELGVRGFDWTYGVAVYASSKVPPATLAKLEALGKQIVAAPDVQSRLRTMAAQPWGASAEELKKRLAIDTVLWNKTLAKVGNLE